ncbi:MAG: VOC family protein [Nocardioides sp.]
MSNQLNAYLHFDGTALEALTFYHSVFGGELTLSTFGEQGMEGPDAEKIMHGDLTAPAITIMAAEAPPGTTLHSGDNVTLCLNGDGADELRAWFAALSEDGEVHVPLEKQMWGDEFGQAADRFGIIWMVNIAG